MVILVYAERTVGLERDALSALADELWKGERAGSVTSAAKLVAALALPENDAPAEVAVEPYEVEAVDAALRALGLGEGTRAAST